VMKSMIGQENMSDMNRARLTPTNTPR